MADRGEQNTKMLTFRHFMRQSHIRWIFYVFICSVVITNVLSLTNLCGENECRKGKCINDSICECFDGWTGLNCDHCTGRVLMNSSKGYIFDGYGNYTEDNKCTWLIDHGIPNKELVLNFYQFSTECGWDHIYIYDGDSVYSPLLAAYSGLIKKEMNSNDNTVLPPIIAKSGKVYVYFYSDAAYNMSGFNLSFSVADCAKPCGPNGHCEGDVCVCKKDYTGATCDIKLCPNNCSANGDCDNGVCKCRDDMIGEDCSMKKSEGLWMYHEMSANTIGRASAAIALVDHNVYVSGGHSFNDDINFLSRYDLQNKVWEDLKSNDTPDATYGHTLVAYNGTSLYMFGGVTGKNETNISRTLYLYDIGTLTWKRIPESDSPLPLAVTGHSAHMVNNIMYVIFGHSPIYGYMNRVQTYNVETEKWSLPKTNGAIIQGGYGHSSAYDADTNAIYVYGGYHSQSSTLNKLTDKLYAFYPAEYKWVILRDSGSPKYLHSASIADGLMIVFGGNSHNDTSISMGAKCYSSDIEVYDISCNSWYTLNSKSLPRGGARYGHRSVFSDSDSSLQLYIFGGFSGIMQENILTFTPGNCSYNEDNVTCLASKQGRKCSWVSGQGCMALKDDPVSSIDRSCKSDEGKEQICPRILTCPTCLSTSFNCHWLSSNCSAAVQLPNATCSANQGFACEANHNCHACLLSSECQWEENKGKCRHATDGEVSRANYTEVEKCKKPCSMYSGCENCTKSSCMWCANRQQCVDTNSYVASFVYGHCMEWTTNHNRCPSTRCTDLLTCTQCQTNPSCGWCNDPSNTGIGKCMEGGAKGPGHDPFKGDNKICPAERWFFVGCPACQCNGHSICNNLTECVSCQNKTTGKHCEYCMEGYFGDSANGGTCAECSCNNQADKCDNKTGVCYCRTRGVVGTKCDKCDHQHKYYGDPRNGGTCYYDLATDYQFTFNLSKKEDKYYTRINYMNVPQSNDRDVDFKVNCSGSAYINISYKTNGKKDETFITVEQLCNYYRAKFEHKDFSFSPSDDNTTFLVYVYGFQTPFWLQISFSQYPKIDLVHFFVTFFSCFLSLLIIAAVLYKIKHKYDNYRRRQRMQVEMEEMASRPFASVIVEVERKVDSCQAEKKDPVTELRKRKVQKLMYKPGQIATEPLHSHKAEILTLMVQLPTGDEEWSPNGTSGVAIASALVMTGHHRKQSVEHGGKGEKTKIKKLGIGQNDGCVSIL